MAARQMTLLLELVENIFGGSLPAPNIYPRHSAQLLYAYIIILAGTPFCRGAV
jgi:hypothetical protein